MCVVWAQHCTSCNPVYFRSFNFARAPKPTCLMSCFACNRSDASFGGRQPRPELLRGIEIKRKRLCVQMCAYEMCNRSRSEVYMPYELFWHVCRRVAVQACPRSDQHYSSSQLSLARGMYGSNIAANQALASWCSCINTACCTVAWTSYHVLQTGAANNHCGLGPAEDCIDGNTSELSCISVSSTTTGCDLFLQCLYPDYHQDAHLFRPCIMACPYPSTTWHCILTPASVNAAWHAVHKFHECARCSSQSNTVIHAEQP